MKEETLERNQTIYENYLVDAKVLTKKRNKLTQEDIIVALASKFSIGEFYIRNILKQYGVTINRKENYDRKDKEDLINRNASIVEKYNNESKEPDEIAADFGISAARVRQVLKAAIGKNFKKTKIAATLELIKADVIAGKSHTEILTKYGKEMLRKVKVNFKYNVFKETKKLRNAEILRRYRSKEVEQIEISSSVRKYNKLDEKGKKIERNSGGYPISYEIIKTWPSIAEAAKELKLKRKELSEVSQREAGHNILGGFEWRAVNVPQNIADSMNLVRDYVYSIVNFKRKK